MEKTKKLGFTLGFGCLDAISSRNKENDKEKEEKLEDRQYFSVFLPLWRFSPPW